MNHSTLDGVCSTHLYGAYYPLLIHTQFLNMALFQAGVGEGEVQAHKVFEQVGAKDA